jgi:putative transposase
MYKTFRFRLYPNDNQIILINKTFGCYRFIYNYFLNICQDNGYRCAFDMIKEIPYLKNKYEWLKEIDSCSLRCALFNLEDAYKNFFSKRSKHPTFKSKFNKQTYRTNYITSEYKGKKYSNIELDLTNKKIKLPKIGLVDIRGYRNLDVINGQIINVTVVKETTGKYYYQVDTYFPSSKACSHCSEKTEITNNLEIRKWECSKCHSINDKDMNASINIMFVINKREK